MVEQALARLPVPAEVTYRPHPASESPTQAPGRRVNIRQQTSVTEDLDLSDIAVCGALSSVAVEAASRGIPTVLVGDPQAFMTSPAEGMPGVRFVWTSAELAEALATGTAGASPPQHDGNAHFVLDRSLTRWRSLLGFPVPRAHEKPVTPEGTE